MRGGVAHQLEADGRAPGLGRGRVDRADADVVDEPRVDRVDLRRRVGGEPDQHVGADELAHLAHRHVLLADVHAVGAHLARDERAVVDDQQRAESLAERPRGVGDRDELLVREVLLAQLHDVDAAGDRRAQELGQRGARSADEVQPRSGQTCAPVGAEVSDGHRSPV